MQRETKICGIKTPEALEAAIDGGAKYIGFVFYPESPRYLSPSEAFELTRYMPMGVKAVGVFVNPDDELLEKVVNQVPLDMIQLHGNESPERLAEIKERYGLPIIKAIPIGEKKDLTKIIPYRMIADFVLLDAKPPKNVITTLPGGNGIAFDWHILSEISVPMPWFLSGGLNPSNVAEAIRTTKAHMLDVSSGIESRPGVKDLGLIKDFLLEVKRI